MRHRNWAQSIRREAHVLLVIGLCACGDDGPQRFKGTETTYAFLRDISGLRVFVADPLAIDFFGIAIYRVSASCTFSSTRHEKTLTLCFHKAR